ncbi:MAG: hypothetical protein DCC68_25970 [Planctomycetota bacterium]|nr:MAG: hypothetical protein DCC68_25970 [Planctomycetota bacterium]
MGENENNAKKPRREGATLIVVAILSSVGSCTSCAYQALRKPHEQSIIEDVDQLWMMLTATAIVVWIVLLRNLRVK